jgi:hypothetical protein
MNNNNLTPAQQLNALRAFGITIGNVNAANGKGNGNRARRRAGWRVAPTAGPDYTREMADLAATI